MQSLHYSFLGAGQMGSAILGGLVRTGIPASHVHVFDVNPARSGMLAEALAVVEEPSADAAVRAADIVVLAVKPQHLGDLLSSIDSVLLARPTWLSIAAGKTLSWLEERLPGARVVRAMPNLAMRVGEGMSALCPGSRATEEDAARAGFVLACAGKVRRMPESLFDAVTALSGSGPAFLAVVLRAFAEGAETLGMAPQDALFLAKQTMLGTAKVLAEGDDSLDAFVRAVTSAKGTTEAGLRVLDTPALRSLCADTLRAAAVRSAELAR
jgi:pyrroline-5-carboxylate reductase